MKDKKISILQYIRSGKISIDYEIRNLKAGRNIDVIIRDFFSNSPDYQKLHQQVKETQSQLHAETNFQQRLFLSKKLNQLNEYEIEFKTDVLKLAEIFSKMELRTERLQQAARLFEQGKIKDADAILKEEDLANDQLNLIVNADYLELQMSNLWKKLIKKNSHDHSNQN